MFIITRKLKDGRSFPCFDRPVYYRPPYREEIRAYCHAGNGFVDPENKWWSLAHFIKVTKTKTGFTKSPVTLYDKDFLNNCIALTESPIEKQFMLHAGYWWIRPFLIIPQWDTGVYRYDFAILRWWDLTDCAAAILCAVELDGHDWHKTKKQRQKDAQKSRYLLAKANIPVIRFTGSEVYNNIDGVFEELDSILPAWPKIKQAETPSTGE